MQVQLPHRHGGMGFRRLSGDVATASRLSSAALAHAALVVGSDKALLFRGAMGLEAHASLARLQEAWPTVKGLADSPDDAAEWPGRKPDGKDLQMVALQRTISHADADAHVAVLFATLEADAKGPSSQVHSAARADLARLRSCAGSLASAWLTARPGPAELTAVESCISARLLLGDDLFAGQDGDDACVLGRSMAAGGTHSLICGALGHTVVTRHNGLTEAWLLIAVHSGIAATRQPHVKQPLQQPRAMGLPALPTCPPPAPSDGGHMPVRASPTTPASAVPSTLHGTQAPHSPVPFARAAPSTPGDVAAAGHYAAVSPSEASEETAPAVANVAAAPSAAVATASPAIAPPPPLNPHAPPGAAAAAHSGGATGTTRFPPRSQRGPQRGDLLLCLPGLPVVVDVCVRQSLASSEVAAAAWGTGVSAEAKDALKRDQYGCTGTGTCRFVPLSHDTCGRAGPTAFALLHIHELEFEASTGAVSKNIFVENAMRDLSTTTCRGIAWQVLASAPLRARLDGQPVLPGRSVRTEFKGSLKAPRHDNFSKTPRCVLLSHETFGHAGHATFALLNEIAEFAATCRTLFNRTFVENDMRDLSTTLRRGIAWQVLATVHGMPPVQQPPRIEGGR